MFRNLLPTILLLIPFWIKAEIPEEPSPTKLVEAAKAKAGTHRDSSLLLLHSALELFEKENQLEAWLDAVKDVGVAFDMAGDLQTSMQVYGFAKNEKLPRQPKSMEEWEAMGWLHANAGFTLRWYGNYFAAKDWYEKAHYIFEEKVQQLDTTDVAYVHRELGNLYTRFGEHEAARLMLERTRQVALEQGATNLAAEATNDLAIALTDHGEHEEAVQICRQALQQPRLNLVSKALLHVTLATSYMELDELETARFYADEAERLLSLVIQNKLHQNGALWLSNLLKLKGQILENESEAADALRRSHEWLAKVFPDTMRREFAKLRMAEAQFLLAHDRPQEALKKQQAALRTVLYRYNETDPLVHPHSTHFYPENTILEALAGKAEAFRKLHEETDEQTWLDHALTCHELIFEAERAYRQVHHFESSKLTLLAESNRRTESAIDAAWMLFEKYGDQKALEKAFEFSEKSKSILLYEALRHSGASSIANVPDSLLIEERKLRESLAEVEKNLFFKNQKEDTTGIADLNLKVLELTNSIQSLVEKMEKEHPNFLREKQGGITRSVTDVQAMLHDDEALVEYFVGRSHVYIFLVKKDDFYVERIKKDFSLEKWVTDFREDIEAFQFPGNDRKKLCENYSSLGVSLYQKLIQPLNGHSLPGSLIIIPDGILGFLPFDALLTKAPAAPCIFKKYPYLVRQHIISYSYSATLHGMLLEKTEREARGEFAGFAPYFPEGNSSGFDKLDGNIPSMEKAVSLFGGMPFSNSAASRQNFFENVANFRMLYLATHAKANMDENGFSFIVLADGDGYDTLFVKDIYNLPPLAAELVFLGACETGSGKRYDGEGIISLARSFLYAGASSIVTTLWSINDDSNQELTSHFFQNIKDGQSKNEALRNAKLSILENDRPDLYAHPVFWAAYTPIGNMEAMGGEMPWWWMGLAAIGLLGLFFIWKRTRGN